MAEPWKTAWICGASTGIGRELALMLAKKGVKTAVSARSEDKLAALAAEHKNLFPYPLDVTDAEGAAETVARIEGDLGALDLSVLNAGDYSPMTLDTFDRDQIKRILDVNYMGVINGVDALLPGLKARGKGHLAITASVAGYRGLPKAAAYGPTKAALINFCECLKNEFDDIGATLTVINPGFVRTPLTDQNDFEMPYLVEPEDAAKTIYQGLKKKKFEIAFPAPFVRQLKIARILPYGWYFPMIRKSTGL
ncbi:MAG: SDR family NAD(P)-dependent oxidoreductase [Pseudomonadota bacterium]